MEQKTTIQVTQKGPYVVKGSIAFVDENGQETTKEGVMALCRCAASKNKPFCDGAHKSHAHVFEK